MEISTFPTFYNEISSKIPGKEDSFLLRRNHTFDIIQAKFHWDNSRHLETFLEFPFFFFIPGIIGEILEI